MARGGDHDVLGLDVPVHESLLVRRREACCHLGGERRRLGNREWTGSESFPESLSLDQLRDDVADPFVLADVEDPDDVRMRKGGDRPSLPFEPPRAVRAGGRPGQDLDRDRAIQARVQRPEDLAHAALPERPGDLVRPEAGSREKAHVSAKDIAAHGARAR